MGGVEVEDSRRLGRWAPTLLIRNCFVLALKFPYFPNIGPSITCPPRPPSLPLPPTSHSPSPATVTFVMDKLKDEKDKVRKELNLKNLKRHDDFIQEIVDSTSYATVYYNTGGDWVSEGL